MPGTIRGRKQLRETRVTLGQQVKFFERIIVGDVMVTRFLCLQLLKCSFTATETVVCLGTGAQDVHLDFHTAPEL